MRNTAKSDVQAWNGPLANDWETFRGDVAVNCVPVVFRQALNDWPVIQTARRSRNDLTDYLRAHATGNRVQLFCGAPDITGRYYYDDNLDGFNFDRKIATIANSLDYIMACVADTKLGTAYLGSLPADSNFPGFSDENTVAFLPEGVEPRIWIGNASSVACHYDTFDNLACVVAGRRTFTLYPPEAIGDLYVGPIDHTMAGQPVGLAVQAPSGDPRYPRFESIREHALEVTLEPGDALYLPKLWWHQVEASEPLNMLVNYWWDGFSAGPDAPLTTLMLAMIAIAERPERERAAWHTFFDHYVFRPERHPLEHLPPDKHGILGPLSEGNYRKVRAAVMQMLRGV
ncbi:cupin-like domain-containing protein [Porphyrobacter algicida]|uniref:Cupin-like domain-containing protein n=1 Tax=Qipengyuania algicida TaxID=1836209 RepID=A0A845AFG6_9SPHN|nr:cupin-like domain-containing protein [Qipengyuania algicida]MXP28217.1 cupin-like domain-containing protein [Qipengyuania algicida]